MRFAIICSSHPGALEAAFILRQRYGVIAPEEAEAFVALGGDGFMLGLMHQVYERKRLTRLPIFGMNFGTVGFLMNSYRLQDLPERLAEAESLHVNPLLMTAKTASGRIVERSAFNDVYLHRSAREMASIDVLVDGSPQLSPLRADGIIAATSVGSTAYNRSAGGPILPLETKALALTPICPFQPRMWRGAVLPSRTRLGFRVNDAHRRPVSVIADTFEIRAVERVDVCLAQSEGVEVLFDPEENLQRRTLREQFE